MIRQLRFFSIFIALTIAFLSDISAQVHLSTSNKEENQEPVQVSFGGYTIARVNGTTSNDSKAKTDMSLRLVRVYVDSKIGDFAMKLQMQVNGNTSGLNGPRIVDAWAEWQRWKGFRIKACQFKRPFTFENPMHPWLIGRGTYSQLAERLAGFSDRTGEHASNGRDIGIQIQGDLLSSSYDRHAWFHYQGGVFTGQGINFSDKNSRKDLIGGVWISPIKELQIGAFGWTGNHVLNDTTTIERRRFSVGAKYSGDWTARVEYAVDNAAGKADAVYAIIGTPSWRRTKLFAHYDLYREGKNSAGSHAIYGLSLQHMPHPDLMVQANYGYNVDKTKADERYHNMDIQLYWRF